MAAGYDLSAHAQHDLLEIWTRISSDSLDLANRIEREFWDLFESLARMPYQGHVREDLTRHPVRFIGLYSYLVAYDPRTRPIRILAVLRGARNVKRVLRERL